MKTKNLIPVLFTLPALCFSAEALAQERQSDNLPDEYLKNLKNYEFVNTQGMMDLAPNRHSWVPAHREDPDNWEFPSDEEIKTLREMGINFPDFSFITDQDSTARLDAGQQRQRTHTIEHILYALPGDALSLYPYYGLEESQIHFADWTKIESTKGFLDTFSHWYDYQTGGRVTHKGSDGKAYDLLDFPSCRGYMQLSDEYGFYGGIFMSPGEQGSATGKVYSVATPQQYIDAVNAINDAGGKGSIELTSDLDFSGFNNVPMLGDNNGHRFNGTFNGQGHTIKNLVISEYDGENVGLVRMADDGARICNLVIDATCRFEGRLSIGLVGKLDQGQLTVSNVVMNATVRGTRDDVGEQFASAILGRAGHNGADNRLHFEDIYIGATVGAEGKGRRFDTALCGWLFTENTHSNTVFRNIIVNGTIHGPEDLTRAKYLRRDIGSIRQDIHDPATNTFEEKHDNYSIIYTNCYGNMDAGDPCWATFTDTPLLAGWKDSTTPGILDIKTNVENLGGQLLANAGHRPWNDDDQERRKAGTSAVFFFPENGELAKEFLNDRTEYVIAADFSQTFAPESHLDIDAMKIKEPLVAFRHIFRIRDGRKQAEELREHNRDYIRRHQHKVTARVGANFQIRLDFPLPTNWGKSGGVTNYYFQKDDETYDRVRQFGLRVLDGDTRKFRYDLGDGLPGNDDRFELGANIRMRRATAADNKEHARALDGMFDYHTMLMKPRVAEESHYIVQVIAKDENGNILQASDGDMVLMEYDITFLPEKGASLLTEDELYSADNRFRHARDEYMKAKYGKPVDNIDFDDFFAINALKGNDDLKKKMISYSVITHTEADGIYKDFPVWAGYSQWQGPGNSPGSEGLHHSFYKWPITWTRSGYSFGYNYRYDYNMYMLTTHSENVPYHAKADEFINPGGERGLYDRLYYKTLRLHKADPRVKVEQGYYYYVNAASDPGVSARLNFNISCPGSRVIVSAWVAELSPADAHQDEPANLSFNFVAVMKDSKERVTLHNFVTGYLGEKNLYTGHLDKPEQLGKWLNVYYSFVPRLSEFYSDAVRFDDVDHFELELAHNGRSSAGSDYAIDDIRAYVVPPYSDAGHDGYACDDSPLDVTVETSFDTLLGKCGATEAFEGDSDENLDLYFAFVDKEMVEEEGNLQKAFVKAVMQGSEAGHYGRISFNNNYRGNERYLDAEAASAIVNDKAYRYSTEGGERLIKFSTTVAPGTLKVGKEYLVVFRSAISEEDTPEADDLAAYFDLTGECRYNCDLLIRPSLKIKLDGALQPESEELSVCENQSPVLQVNVWSTDKEPVEVVKNAYFDWFDGSMNDFCNYRFGDYSSREIREDDFDDTAALTLRRALEVFRMHYGDAETTAGIVPEEGGEDSEHLMPWMLDIIDIASSPDPTGRIRLHLHQASYVMPPLDLPDGVQTAKARVVAVPLVDLYPDGSYKSVCSSPTEIGVNVANRTPILRHGLKGITYPENMTDVPLRVGLSQLRKDGGTSMAFSKKRLDMPIRTVTSTDGKEKSFTPKAEDSHSGTHAQTRSACILLVQTNDPDYRDLGTLDASGQETGNLLWVGEITELNASTDGGSGTDRNHFIAEFADDFRFKEGYYYRMRYRFEEDADGEINADDVAVCQGQDVFTLKIVPEYARWTAARNLSWDNDSNWRRIDSSEILKVGIASDDAQFSDGGNANRRAYAPLAFTRVVIDRPSEDANGKVLEENPWLCKAENTKVADDYDPTKENPWTSDIRPDYESANAIGDPTALIQYDMTGYVATAAGLSDLRCRPWTANTCSDIHFNSGATLMGQQHLIYDRAWVDVELDHSRWYLLSSPLQDVVAGDFYLPTAGCRQTTELFQPIEFDEKVNHRFAPAVYQRGWDKGQARVYEFGKDGSRNAAVRTFWSHVYNDVAEPYGYGNAFSIKADVSNATKPAEKVLFRLPKADNSYSYYLPDGKTSGHPTEITSRDSGHRLNPTNGLLKSTTANAGRFFLIGNPFMTYLDIKEFLLKNQAVLEPQYWIVSEKGLISGSFSSMDSFTAIPYSEDDMAGDPTAVAPMQGFFVKAKADATSVELNYDENMMRRYDADGWILEAPTRAGMESSTLRISSFNGENPSSAAVIFGQSMEEGMAVDAFDLRDLGVPSTVFTAMEGTARAIDFCRDAEGMEIGLIADEDTETRLLFECQGEFDDMLLLDSEDGSLTPLHEIKEIKVKGSASGRFFLTSGLSENFGIDSFRWDANGHCVNVRDLKATGSLNVIIYDTLGRIVDQRLTGSDTLTLSPGRGVFVMVMANSYGKKTVKINL